MRRTLFALAVILASGSPVLAQSISAEVERALEAYVQAINEGRSDALSAMYVDGPTTGSVGDGQIYRGWSTVRDLLRSVVSEGAVELVVSNVTVMGAGADAAIAYFDTEWRYGPPSSSRVVGAMTVVFVRTDSGWRVAHDHTSTRAVQNLQGTTSAPAPGLGVLADFGAGPQAPIRATDECHVTRIVDGDTIDCDPFGRVRLIGMDTPEAEQRPFGDMATNALAQLIPLGSVVEIEGDVEAQDRYGRALGYIWSDGRLVNWWMVRAGYAVVLTYPPNVQYVDWFTEAQREAFEDGVGLWAVDGFECEPRAHRRGECGLSVTRR